MDAKAAAAGAVDVVIVNWNAGGYLADCLRTVHENTAPGTIGQVVVVDNASTDDSLQRAAAWLDRPTSIVMRNPDNCGFAVACNQGAWAGSAPFVLFLNPDTRVEPGAIERVVEHLRSPAGRTVGICGCRVLDRDGRPTMAGGPFPSLRVVVGQLTGLSRLLPAIFPPKRVVAGERSGPMDHVIGAFFLVRRSLFEQLGGFDEKFFMYYEEVDLCFRARRAGWGTYHLAEAEVVHVGNVSSDQVRGRRLTYSLTSRRRYAAKHWPPGQRRALAALTLLVEFPARLLAEGLRDRRIPRETLEGFSGYLRARADATRAVP